jgi:Domain of unknown function (DUF4351)
MPVLNDILDHKILGPAIKQGIQQGMQEGIQQGMQQGEMSVLRRILEKRFGPLPGWAEERLTRLSIAELEDLSLRVLDAKGIDDLLDRG